ncbi:MAG: hypothetical protein KAI17_13640 [Thiotrichaceae bacterium]|nr:hypothetical protein [Thiotrichaceae bacterium]
MHPVIKMVSLVILSIFSTQGGWDNLFLTIIIIAPFYFFRIEIFYPALQMLFRLKWLFLSIILIYYLLSPETAHLLSALLRISVLITIIFSVNLYLKTSTIEQILESLLWIFYPLKYMQIDVVRLALRAILTLEYIEVLTLRLEQYQHKLVLKNTAENKPGLASFLRQRKERLFNLIKHSGIIFQDILQEISTTKTYKEYSIDCIEAPDVQQLMIPVLLCVLYIFNPISMMNL